MTREDDKQAARVLRAHAERLYALADARPDDTKWLAGLAYLYDDAADHLERDAHGELVEDTEQGAD